MTIDETAAPIIAGELNEPKITPDSIQEAFCPTENNQALVFKLLGGFELTPPKNVAVPSDACGQIKDLTGLVQSALAPLQPFFTLTDILATLIQCFLLAIEAIGNPFKIPKLLGCVPGLVGKVNNLLALIPVLPQGAIGFVGMVVSAINLVSVSIDCAVQTFTAIRDELAELDELIARGLSGRSPTINNTINALVECGQEATARRITHAVDALAPVARILCSVRALLLLIPGGKPLADQLTFPDPTNLANASSLDVLIEVLETLRDILNGLVDAVSALAVGFSLDATPAFSCPLDDASSSEEEEEVDTPVLVGLTDPTTNLPLGPPEAGNAIDPDLVGTTPDVVIDVSGTGFSDTTKFYWQTVLLESERRNEEVYRVTIPDELRTVSGDFFLTAVNEPSGGPSAFSGLTEDLSPPADEDNPVKVSNQLDIEVG